MNRRSLIRNGAAVSGAVALGGMVGIMNAQDRAAAAACADISGADPVVLLWEAWRAKHDAIAALPMDATDDEMESLAGPRDRLEADMMALPAVTIAGVLAKLRVYRAMRLPVVFGRNADELMALNAIEDLERLLAAGGAA